MAKSLSQRITERARTKKPTATGKNRAAFLSVREEIKCALDDGWPVKTIWETLREEGTIAFGYDAFMRYVNHLIEPREQPQPAAPSILGHAATDKNKGEIRVQNAAAPKSTSAIGGFNFQPPPKEEDLF
jgi:hypothetical protein